MKIMNKAEFERSVIMLGINPNSISLDYNDSTHEGYGIRKNIFSFEVYYRERDVDLFVLGYPSEEDALEALFEELKRLHDLKKSLDTN